jgi:hypothetical protein
MSYGRMKQAEPKVAAEVAGWLAQAADDAEDAQHGAPSSQTCWVPAPLG